VLHVSCSIRTLIRSFEREVYVIPNAVFSKNAVLNVTRKSKEFRFYEYLCVRVQDVHKVNTIIQVCNPLAPTPSPPPRRTPHDSHLASLHANSATLDASLEWAPNIPCCGYGSIGHRRYSLSRWLGCVEHGVPAYVCVW
jgi:hypothetical protein